MKLKFSKNSELQPLVALIINNKEQAFTYVEMIKQLILEKGMESPEISNDYSKPESESIIRMVALINEKISGDT